MKTNFLPIQFLERKTNEKIDEFKTKYTKDMHDFFKAPEKKWMELFSRKDREIHLFMHCHMRDLDRKGEGLNLYRNPAKIDKDTYGVPIEFEEYWTSGYHVMDRTLAYHMFQVRKEEVNFPPVAGYVGATHLYKPFTEHANNPWNWTAWIPRWSKSRRWDPNGKVHFVNDRFFMGFRANEIQNNFWDYDPLEDAENPHGGEKINVCYAL